VKRRRSREQDEAEAKEQVERRREALLADLRARQGLASHPEPADVPEPATPPAEAPETEPAGPEAG
jgi:hypothetical protein